MEIIKLLEPFNLPIDTVMIILVLISGLFQKKYFGDIAISGASKTLLASFVFCSIYCLLFSLANGFREDLPLKWFFSYALATSLYELLFKKIFNKEP